jgi:hypothetical protein
MPFGRAAGFLNFFLIATIAAWFVSEFVDSRAAWWLWLVVVVGGLIIAVTVVATINGVIGFGLR